MFRLIAARTALAVLCVCTAVGTSRAGAQGAPPAALTTEEWRADLRALADGLVRYHPDLFKWTPKASFDSAVADLDARIPSLDRDRIVAEMMKIVALPGDGHTALFPLMNPGMGFHRLPIRFYQFSDGFYVRSADPRYASLVGGRVLSIGKFTLDSALERVKPFVARENGMWETFLVPEMLAIPEILYTIGATSDTRGADIRVERDGKVVSARVANDGASSATFANFITPFDKGFVDAATSRGKPLPVALRSMPRMMGVDWLPESRVLYVQYNAVANAPDLTVEQLAERVRRMIDTLPVEKLALDLRLNSGGNDGLNRPLLRAIGGSKIDKRGKFFTIIGRQTYSAAQLLTNDLERFTETTFVGEPTGSRVNFFADGRELRLPNSQLTISVSRLWWQRMDPRDVRPWTAATIPTPLSFAQYVAGIDPALDAIINWRPLVP